MANYLERVASSAGRKAAVAKPPSSGPPVLPAGRDFLPHGQELFSSSDDEPFAGGVVDKAGKPQRSGSEESKTATPRAGSTVNVEPPPGPTASTVSLKNDSPFTVHLPKTLRPVSQEKPSAPVDAEPPPIPAPRFEASRSLGVEPNETRSDDERPASSATPGSVDHWPTGEAVVEEFEMKPATPEPRPAAFREPEVTAKRTSTPPGTRSDGPLPVAMPKQTPAVVVGSASRPEPSRISIGEFEVIVNNHPVVQPVRPPAAAPRQSNNANLERRYLDRFRLRR